MLDILPEANILDRTRGFAARVARRAEQADASAEIAPETWRELHSSGLAMAPLPVRFGGWDLIGPTGHRELVTVLRLIGSSDLSVARVFEGHVNAVELVCRYGSPAQAADLARDIAQGALSAVWGADDAAGLHAYREPAGWRLQGRKIWASGAGHITRPVVTAKTEAGQILLMLRLEPGERADLSGWTPRGMRSSATGTVELTGYVAEASQQIGAPGDYMRQPHFSGGAWRFCAVHLGAMERLVDLLREHLVTRKRSGDPFQLQRVAGCVAAVTTAKFWIAEVASKLASYDAAGEVSAAALVAFANLTRTVTERAGLDVLEHVERGVGLGAFIRPHPIERITRDLATYLRQPVPDAAMADAAGFILASDQATGSLWAEPSAPVP